MAAIVGTNSYARADQAQTYWEDQFDRLSGLDFTEDQINAALVTAATLMNQLPWDGTIDENNVGTQILAFPRSMNIPGNRPGNFSGRPTRLDNETPVVIMNMQMELAFHLLSNPGITTDTGGQLNNASLTAGSVELTGLRNASVIPSYIRQALRMYLRTGANSVFVGG